MTEEREFLSEKELRLLTAVLMRDDEVKKLYWRWRKHDQTQSSAIVKSFDGGYIRVQSWEVRDLLYKISSLAGVGDDVKNATTEIFDDMKRKADAQKPAF